jgi:hypothetical protein
MDVFVFRLFEQSHVTVMINNNSLLSDYVDLTELPGLPATTHRPTPALLLTTTTPGPLDCRFNDELYADGARIEISKPCEHCYCMRGDIVCAVQECGTPLEREGKNCTALPPQPGQCCPEQYQCGKY